MRRRWTFARRVGAGLVASGVVAVAILVTSVLAVRSVHVGNEMEVLERSTDLLEVERLRRSFSDKVASSRDFMLTRQPLFHERKQADRQRFLSVMERLRMRLRNGEEAVLLTEVSRTENAHEQALSGLLEPLIREPGLRAVDAQQVTLMGHTRDQTEAALERLVRHSEARLVSTIQEEVLEDRSALVLVISVASLGMLGMVCLAWVLTRQVRPLYKEAEASEQRFRLVVEGVQDYAIYLLDSRGRVESWNPGAERIKGWREDEVLGRHISIFYTPEAVAAGEPERDLTRAERDGRLRAEGWRVRKDGTRFWGEVIYTALRDDAGELRGFAKVTRDITERRRVERTQRLFAEAGRIFNQLLEPDLTLAELARLMVPELADGCVLFLLSPGGRLLPRAVTHAEADKERALWELLHRYPPDMDSPCGLAPVIRIGHAERAEEVTEERLAEVAWDEDHLRLLRRLELRSALSVPVAVGEQRSGALVLVSSSPERRYTATDQVFLEELAGRAALAVDNARLFQEAQRALELIGVASHDLGNPLNAMQLLLARLQRVVPEHEPERVREGLAAALRHGQRLGQLLHNLLDLSRLSSGKLALEVSRVDLAELVREVVERHTEQAAEAGCTIRIEAEAGLVGWWDRLRLERVVTNLLSNALKFGRGKPVELRLERVGGHAQLTVRDHGVGIPPEAQRRIFERFERERSAGQHAGFGLGLYIVRQLVEAHGGTIRVDSTPGDGAAFTVDLPQELHPGVDLGPSFGSDRH
ncbi:ATP-binding protein [Hyalangium rubrum]|uniref:histidine kinase n=1 Tax=Hyalangium rubrum TaxID=3103134 RepID=A0ABU5GZD3_9BACT|nr:ATP-binding protein [Hyalangium sp. s54d21]MDY7226500.1 ATP-binding protein [Hyalangium sp. s54d21]